MRIVKTVGKVTVGLMLTAGLLAGCASYTYYPNSLAKNLQIKKDTSGNGFFSSIELTAHVHHVKPDCTTQYEGVMTIDADTYDIGLPPNRLNFLYFNFSTGNSMVSRGTLLQTRPGYRYEIRARYKKSIYNFELLEFDSKKSKGRKIEFRPKESCVKTLSADHEIT